MTRNWISTSINKIIKLLILTTLLWSCEEKIVVNLANDNPLVVIESYISNSVNPIVVKITRSQAFFNQSAFVPVKNATVQIESLTITEKMVEAGAGFYLSNRLQGKSGRSYSLKVTSGTSSFGASVTLPYPVPIDTVYFATALFQKDSLNAIVEFRDPAVTENYYRIKLYYNGRYAVNDYFLATDAFSDGQKIVAPIYYHNFAPGDTVIVELLNVERNTWRYFKALSESIQHGFNSQAPGNPPTNITGGALGIFGAYGSSQRRLIVPRPLGGK